MTDEIIIDEYSLVTPIATGSSTQVWEVVDKVGGNRDLAMKILLPEALADSEQKAVLKHEAKIGQKFEHPNLVRIIKSVMTKKYGYMIMEYFRAPNLKMQLQADLPAVQVRVVRMFEQLCLVIGYLHDRGWIHRDIKPDNILFNKSSELKLIDFSLTTRASGAVAKVLGSKEKVIQGTRTYIAPEVILKSPPMPQSDMYSLGVTLFEVLTGEPPFRGSSPDDLLKKHLISAAPAPSYFNPNVTPEMDRLVLKLLAKKVKDRHKSMHEILAEFRNVKPFKEDVMERDQRLKKELEEKHKHSLDKSGRLDSRADHLKQQLLKENPELLKQYETERKRALAADAAKAAAIKAAIAKSNSKSDSAAAASSTPPPTPPAPSPVPPAPAMPAGYPPSPYGYPSYPQPGYPYPAYPMASHPAGGYPPGAAPGMPHPQQMPPPQPHPVAPQMSPPQPPRPQQPGPYPPAQPVPGYPGGMPSGIYGQVPYGSQMRMPGVPQRQPMRPALGTPGVPPQEIVAEQKLLDEMMGQPAPQQPGAPAARPTPPVPQQKPPAPKPAASQPPARNAGQQLPLMDQLPPIK